MIKSVSSYLHALPKTELRIHLGPAGVQGPFAARNNVKTKAKNAQEVLGRPGFGRH